MMKASFWFTLGLVAAGAVSRASTLTNESVTVGGRLLATLTYPRTITPGESSSVTLAVTNLTDQVVECTVGLALSANRDPYGECIADLGGEGTNAFLGARSGVVQSCTVTAEQYGVYSSLYLGSFAYIRLQGVSNGVGLLDGRTRLRMTEPSFEVTVPSPLTVGSNVTLALRLKNPYASLTQEWVRVDLKADWVFGVGTKFESLTTVFTNVPPLTWVGVTNVFIATRAGSGEVGFSVFGSGMTFQSGDQPIMVMGE